MNNPTAPIKRIYRSDDEAQLAGVCAGLGHYLNLDPVFVRIVTLAVTFLTGILPGLLSYLAAWILIPREPSMPAAHRGWAGDDSPQAGAPSTPAP